MNWVSAEVVSILWFLLPGFVATWVFAGLTAYPKLTEFERVIEALIFTAFAQTSTFLLKLALLGLGAHWRVVGEWNNDAARVWSVILGALLGLTFAALANRDLVHRMLRPWATTLTGYPSEWFGVLKERAATHAVVLHLPNDRRLYGRVDEWPTDLKKGHFSIWDAEWLLPKGSIPLGVARILVPAADVSFIEFKEIVSGTSQAADPAASPATPPRADAGPAGRSRYTTAGPEAAASATTSAPTAKR
jgi:hypothetical protein